MVLIRINSYLKKEFECIYHTNWYNNNTNWLTWICIILIHINLSFSPTNRYINWLRWICMILIHINLCFYPTNWYVLIHIHSRYKKEIESWIYFSWTFLYELVRINSMFIQLYNSYDTNSYIPLFFAIQERMARILYKFV